MPVTRCTNWPWAPLWGYLLPFLLLNHSAPAHFVPGLFSSPWRRYTCSHLRSVALVTPSNWRAFTSCDSLSLRSQLITASSEKPPSAALSSWQCLSAVDIVSKLLACHITLFFSWNSSLFKRILDIYYFSRLDISWNRNYLSCASPNFSF